MRIAVLADIHANLEALRTCLAHAEREGATQYVFLGDLVGYGADPVACLGLLADHADRGALLVRGNHDDAALGGLCETMNFVAREATYWTRAQLGSGERDFLAALPYSGHVHHPSLYFAAGSGVHHFQPVAGAPISLSGRRRWLAIGGSVGQPRDGNNAAAYALYDEEQRMLKYFRLPYDHLSAARKILAAGLPERLALRLQKGE